MCVLEKTTSKDILLHEDENGIELYYIHDRSLPHGNFIFGGYSIIDAKIKRDNNIAIKSFTDAYVQLETEGIIRTNEEASDFDFTAELKKKIGANIKNLRSFLGLTVREFAHLTDMHASQVSMIETGQSGCFEFWSVR